MSPFRVEMSQNQRQWQLIPVFQPTTPSPGMVRPRPRPLSQLLFTRQTALGSGAVFLPRESTAQLKRHGVGVSKELVVKQTPELAGCLQGPLPRGRNSLVHCANLPCL